MISIPVARVNDLFVDAPNSHFFKMNVWKETNVCTECISFVLRAIIDVFNLFLIECTGIHSNLPSFRVGVKKKIVYRLCEHENFPPKKASPAKF